MGTNLSQDFFHPLVYVWRAAAPVVQQSINIFCPPRPQQQTRRTLLQRTNGTDRRTDERAPYRFIDPAPQTMRTVPINATLYTWRAIEMV